MLRKLINNGYLNPHQFRSWIEGILSKVNLQLPLVTNNGTVKLIKIKKSGPAFTLIINILSEKEDIYVDFVPALSFTKYSVADSGINFNEFNTVKVHLYIVLSISVSFYTSYIF